MEAVLSGMGRGREDRPPTPVVLGAAFVLGMRLESRC